MPESLVFSHAKILFLGSLLYEILHSLFKFKFLIILVKHSHGVQALRSIWVIWLILIDNSNTSISLFKATYIVMVS